jgi:predicted MFS family arabinose efflux permease
MSDEYPRNRAGVLLCTMGGMAASHLLLAVAPTQLLAATILIGINFGGMFAVAPVITGELFGHAHLGTNWG